MRSFIFLSSTAISAELGERVRQLRLRANLTQQQLAGMAGASSSSVRRLEASGQGTLDMLVRVAQALQVSAQLEALFASPASSIADAERLAQAPVRQRARAPRRAQPGKTLL